MAKPTQDWRSKARKEAAAAGAQTPNPGGQFEGVIRGVNEGSEAVDIDFYGGRQKARVLHPYVGIGAWMRVMPETGTAVVASHRFDSSDLQINQYGYDTADRVEKYEAETGTTYRKLRQGEFDIASSGFAQIHGSRRGNLELRGGFSWMHLRNERMQIEARTGVHRRSLPWQAHDELGAEERFGMVLRKGLVTPAVERFINAGPVVAMEYYRSLYTQNPAVLDQALVLTHEGNLLDDSGLPIRGGPVSAPLRAKYGWRSETLTEVKAEIDIVGNVLFELPVTAVAGLHVKSPLMVKIDSTGIAPASRIYLDGINWWHGHAGPFGLTSGPVPLTP